MAGRKNSPEDNLIFDNQFENDFSDPEDVEIDSPVVHPSQIPVLERESLSSHEDENPEFGTEGPKIDGNGDQVLRAAVKELDQHGGPRSLEFAKESQGYGTDLNKSSQIPHIHKKLSEFHDDYQGSTEASPSTQQDKHLTEDDKKLLYEDDSQASESQTRWSVWGNTPDNVTSQTSGETKNPETDRVDLEARFADAKRVEPVWKLDDEDLMCLPLVTKVSEGEGSSAAKQRIGKTSKTPRRRALRLLSKKSKDGSKIRYTSMLGMIKFMAKSSGIDMTKLLQSSEKMFGSTMRFPCMQCFEGGGTEKVMTSMLSSMMGSYGTSGSHGGGANDRCPKCGGQVLTLATFGRMIAQMRSVLQEKELVPHDVYPDGNCLFAAVVDQLRIRGNFNFTMNTLRQAAVQYLRDNPMAEDGLTPLEMFLADESWEAYLTRMAQDGEWGDHIVLGAISNLTGMQITIYGGMSGTGETVIKPKTLSDVAEAGKNDVSETIVLGHLSESHYMSLRPKRWKQKLSDDMCTKTRLLAFGTMQKVPSPIQLIDLILRQAFRMCYIKSFLSEAVEQGLLSKDISKSEDNGTNVEVFGSVTCQMFPGKPKYNMATDDINIFFPDARNDESSIVSGDASIIFLEVPEDTLVVRSLSRARVVDVVAEKDSSSPYILHLVPKRPSLWTEQVYTTDDGAKFLKTFDMICENMDPILTTLNSQFSGFNAFISFAFKCEWPESAMEWISRRRSANFPDQKTLRTIVDGGCHVVPLDRKLEDILDNQVPEQDEIGNYSWSYTFAAAEKEISRFLTPEQRQCFLLFKVWVDSSSGEHKIPNSILKSTFFYSCENIEKQVWKSRPGECLTVLLKNLQRFLACELVPHYFIIDKNLLDDVRNEDIATWSSKLEVAQTQPFVTLFFILDKLDVLSSELGSFVEEIIQEMINVDSDGFQGNSFHGQHDALISARSTLLQNLIYQEEYQSAMYILQDTAEENEAGTETTMLEEKYAEVIKRSCWDMHIGYQWLFALFVDISIKTKVTSKLSDYGAVHITEVFGPECLEELPDTRVPEAFKIENGDLLFPYQAMSVFSQCVSLKCYIKSFKFYLKKYAELAGEGLIIPTRAEYAVYGLDRVSEGARSPKQLMQECATASWLMNNLNNMYVTLFNMCNSGRQTEEFREMMPVMAKIVESVGTVSAQRNLKMMWTYLGERDKAAQIPVKATGEYNSRYVTYYELD